MNKLAYVDNNIIVDFEQKKLSRSDLLNNIDKDISAFYYSAAHLQEALELQNSNLEKFPKRLETRLSSITQLTQNKYFYLELASNRVHKYIMKPKVVYDTITQVKFGQSLIKSTVNLLTEREKEIFRELIDVDVKRINNYSPKEIIDHITVKMKEVSDTSIVELIEYGVKQHPNGKSFGLQNRFAGIFEFLDMIGYWKDKANSKSNYARLWDSSHAFFSAHCDYFICDDRRTRKKAEVVFELYGIKTKVVSSTGHTT